jgi:hypothetical protein
MRSELNELALIDSYLLKQLDREVTRAFEAGLLLNEAFAEKVEAQRMAHRVIRLYGRREERRRLDNIYRLLQREPAFAGQLTTIFT